MSFRDCVVIESDHDWRIVVGDQSDTLGRDASVEEIVTCINVLKDLAGLKSPACVLAPSSNSCFFAALEIGEEIDARDRAALSYELEDHLPIDAESTAADFVLVPPASTEAPRTISAVAVEVDRWRTIADAFEMAGIPLRSIVPAAVLLSRSICRGWNLTDTVEVFAIAKPGCDMITIRGETILRWKHAVVDAAVLRRHRLLEDSPPDRVVVVGGEPGEQQFIREVYGEVEVDEDSIESHLVAAADLYLADPSSRWLDLRCDRLGPSDPLRPIRSELRLATLAAAACLLSIVIGGWWRTTRIEAEISKIHSQQRVLFEKAFPEARVPGALLRRVCSEHTRVMGSRGASSEVDVPQSAPAVLHELLAALPANVRFRVTSLAILDGEVDLDLQVRSPVDAGALATSLSSAGFDVKPPVTTQKDAKTFDSVLEAVWIGTGIESSTARDGVSVRISIATEVTG